MSLPSQLSLSIELTRLLPVVGSVATAAGGAIIRMARDLRQSGSDIVVEEDVAGIFSHVVIDSNFEATFRQAIGEVIGFSILANLLPIGLRSGPGPTVQRAIKFPHYMPMVIQLSLLAATHDLESLAEGLSEAMRLRTKDPLTGIELPSFTSNELKGLLRACQDQTSGFQWAPLIHKVEAALNLQKFYWGWPRQTTLGPNNATDLYQALTIPLLQASLDMLAAVQHIYKDSMMVIDSCKGVSTMVVWAHYILGLNVHVTNTPSGTVRFGHGTPSVVINFPAPGSGELLFASDSIAYLMNISGDILLKVEGDSEISSTNIIAERRYPIQGYASHAFQRDPALLGDSAIADMCHYSAALAKIYANRIWEGRRNAKSTEVGNLDIRSLVYRNPALDSAIELILGPVYNKQHIAMYASSLSGLNQEDMPPPPSVQHFLEQDQGELQGSPRDGWQRILQLAVNTSFVILAFSAVGDLPACKMMVLSDLSCTLPLPPLCSLVNIPTATAPIIIDNEEWYKIIASLLAGRKRNTEYHETCLFSGWGWSVFMDSFADCDPFDTVPGRIWVQRGVPCHDGAVAHCIRDGPCTIDNGLLWATKVESFGSSFQPRSACQITPVRYMLAHREDSFFVCKRYKSREMGAVSAIGYGKLAAARFSVHVVAPCEHAPNAPTDRLQLGLGMATLKGFTFGPDQSNPTEKILVCLSYGDIQARWLALVGLRSCYVHNSRRPVLRGPRTCVSCFLKRGSQCGNGDDLLLIL